MELWPALDSNDLSALLLPLSAPQLNLSTVTYLRDFISQGVPAAFCLQLALSVFNAHNILSALKSSATQSLSCIVYINSSQLRGNNADSLSLSLIQMMTIRLLQAMQLELEADGDDEVDAMDEEAKESMVASSGLRFGEVIPVLVLPVVDLPRNALVEVELIADASSLPLDLLIPVKCNEGGQMMSDSIMPLIIDAPEKSVYDLLTIRTPSNSQDQYLLILKNISVETHLTCFSKCLCSGYVSVYSSPPCCENSSLYPPFTLFDTALLCLFFKIRVVLKETRLSGKCIVSMRLFWSDVVTMPRETFATLASSVAATVLHMSLPPLVIISLPGSHPLSKSLVACQLLAIDIVQLKTEFWVRAPR